jgi:hypothetical protein
MLTAFAVTSMGCAYIRSRKYQFQTHGEIDALHEPNYVSLMRQDFPHSLEPDIEFEPDEIIGERAHAVRHGFAKPDGKAKGEATEEEFHNSGDDSPVEEAPRFATLLQEEFSEPLEERPSRDFLDGVTELAEVKIR